MKSIENLICEKFIITEEDDNGCLHKISFQNENTFNYAFDVIDVLGKQCGKDTAMLYVDGQHLERKFTFEDMMYLTNKTANYFESLGIKKGDKVMLVLKSHYQFWICILALHKIGAIAIPTTSQLKEQDFIYRFEIAKISAVVCTTHDEVAAMIENALTRANHIVRIKIIVNGTRNGWHCYDKAYEQYSHDFERRSDSPCGNDIMLMFFTSGTTAYPKVVTHNYKYPLGHYITAKYWHNIQPGGLHHTIADTGWGKALWGKLYGQWLCKGIVFIYDYDRFNASELLGMFHKYNIVTFCAPPTVYRMLLKEPLKEYDLTSIKCATTAGEPLSSEVFMQFKNATGISIMEGFGQTETTLVIGTLKGTTPKPGSMGKAIPSYPIALLNTEGNECSVNEIGEVAIYDDSREICGLFRGYDSRPDLTNDVWHDGFYHTGDLAKKDEDGFYWYIGRADDMIKSSGYRIGPFEVENIIMALPYVVECGISPEPDEIRGQIIKASIVLTKGTAPTEELKKQIQDYVKSITAPYKYPRKIVFVDELPKTISGKVMRNKL